MPETGKFTVKFAHSGDSLTLPIIETLLGVSACHQRFNHCWDLPEATCSMPASVPLMSVSPSTGVERQTRAMRRLGRLRLDMAAYRELAAG
jgi:hypothetical protein